MSDRKTKVILKVERLTHIYDTTRGSIHALEDVSFEIREGEFVTFLGPSGCGKTTTLRIIAGLITPTSGGILLRGKPLKRASKDIGVVFQQPNLLFHDPGHIPLRYKEKYPQLYKELYQKAAEYKKTHPESIWNE